MRVTSKFITAKKQGFFEAVRDLQGQFVKPREIHQYVSLTNGMLDAFIKAGILITGPKSGKTYLVKINPGKLNDEAIRIAYEAKAHAKHKKVQSKSVERIACIAKQEGLVSKIKSETAKKKEPFPTLEDCTKFLKHHYGMSYEVILVPEGYKLDSFTIKSL